ncbi:transposase [Accumulibacter sp.]|uniref:transposase n=1 Tax=Accumulibacter sp. TaxID=2053492 RepID=UPI0025DEA6CF|nr:transposase [Accumulibacter sp.]MCM8625208.1 transposase [Accumulibacter sp.]
MCFDRFAVVALGSKALDEARRAEVRSRPELWGTRWSLLKTPSAWTTSQLQTCIGCSARTARPPAPRRSKQALRAIRATARSPDEARPLFQGWLSWARRCRLDSFKRLARTITSHLNGVLSGFAAGKHDGCCEAINRALQEARARARGDRRATP